MSIFMRLRLMIKFLFDKNIPLRDKWWIILPAIYIISPIDLIPFPILGFSLIDDLVVLIFTLHMIQNKTQKYYGDNTTESKKTKKDLHGKEIIEDVEYKVDDNK
ncbi:hypothetical protein JYG23_06110 [Sedimentibacter sp. zth1]|uniref:YkvA family protein n=1 Tax=Sedimentibacter sp. zth1 TaxID=2816908 RepID=UPI001A937B29|nr:hypothetical protein [Sedimentibacter sp. zth1]QSX06960.1 hypothetical protein JYG23_06110 [Sedimentibacter sp. zth1]